MPDISFYFFAVFSGLAGSGRVSARYLKFYLTFLINVMNAETSRECHPPLKYAMIPQTEDVHAIIAVNGQQNSIVHCSPVSSNFNDPARPRHPLQSKALISGSPKMYHLIED